MITSGLPKIMTLETQSRKQSSVTNTGNIIGIRVVKMKCVEKAGPSHIVGEDFDNNFSLVVSKNWLEHKTKYSGVSL